MPIKQESMIELLQCGKAWRGAMLELRKELKLLQSTNGDGRTAIDVIMHLIFLTNELLPSPEHTAPIDQYDLHYRLRSRGNLVRRSELNSGVVVQAAKAEERRKRAERTNAAPMTQDQVDREYAGYLHANPEADGGVAAMAERVAQAQEAKRQLTDAERLKKASNEDFTRRKAQFEPSAPQVIPERSTPQEGTSFDVDLGI
jgi:hypothetical protein